MAQEIENWKPIPVEELKNDYEVSDLGNVRNKNSKYVFKQNIINGYKTVNIKNKNVRHFITVSRIVLEAFTGKDETKPICNHKDGNKLNNRLDNLEWTTQQENVQHALDNELIGLHKRKVMKYDKEGNFIAEYNSINEAAEAHGVDRTTIGKVLSGKNQTAAKFKWKYSDEVHVKKEVDLSEFKTLEGNQNYMVSKKGEVYSVVTKILLKPVITHQNKCYVTICDGANGNKKKNCYVHTLVANTYLPNDDPENKNIVNHKDNNMLNNHVDNLEWVTRSESRKRAIEKKNALVQSQNEESSDGARENLAVMA